MFKMVKIYTMDNLFKFMNFQPVIKFRNHMLITQENKPTLVSLYQCTNTQGIKSIPHG